MSGHDSHAPVQETKGIWALPLAAWLFVIVLVFVFTIDCSKDTGEKHGEEHHKTEAHH